MMQAIKRIEVDGNDGAGKSFRIQIIKKMFPTVEVVDRGLFSKYTLDEYYPRLNGDESHLKRAAEFRHIVREESADTLFIILDCPISVCQDRIMKRGDSLDTEFHSEDELAKYEWRFRRLYKLVEDCPNVIIIDANRHLTDI